LGPQSVSGTSGNVAPQDEVRLGGQESGSIWDYFNRPDPEVTVSVNRYLWTATLDVLSFLPVTSVDPFTGVIITGYGTPPGGGRSYRATVRGRLMYPCEPKADQSARQPRGLLKTPFWRGPANSGSATPDFRSVPPNCFI